MDNIRQVNLADIIYIKPEITKDWLIKNNFKYNRLFSDSENNIYTYRFPIHKNGYFTTLECELSCIESGGMITVDVYDYGTRNKYAAFYCAEYGNYKPMITAINNRIKSELKKLGIKKYREVLNIRR